MSDFRAPTTGNAAVNGFACDNRGSMEADADIVAFVSRPIVSDQNAEDRDAEIVIAKPPNGPRGTVALTFMSEDARFENRADDDATFAGNGAAAEEDRRFI